MQNINLPTKKIKIKLFQSAPFPSHPSPQAITSLKKLNGNTGKAKIRHDPLTFFIVRCFVSFKGFDFIIKSQINPQLIKTTPPNLLL